MPAIRDYTQFDTLEATDALVVDRLGVGTGYVETSLVTALQPTGVVAGSYLLTNLTVNEYGQITVAADGAGGAGLPGGSTTQVQYNLAGTFGGITGATTDGTTLSLVAPILGTPASGTLTNTTGLPLTTGVVGNLAVTHLNSGTAASSTTFWRGDGTWATPATGGTPGGSNTQVQYNNSGAFGGSSGITLSATQATLVAPILGTPASGTLTNTVGLPLSTGVVGNLAPAHLNSGTSASSSTFWRGDGTWATPGVGFSPFSYPAGVTTPTAGSFTVIGGTGVTPFFTNLGSGRGVSMGQTALGSINQILASKASPDPINVTVTAMIMVSAAFLETATSFLIGPCFVDGSGNIASLLFDTIGGAAGASPGFFITTRAGINATSGLSVNATYINGVSTTQPMWLRLTINSTDMAYAWSFDGETWCAFNLGGSSGRSNWITGDVVSVGMFYINLTTDVPAFANVYSFDATTP